MKKTILFPELLTAYKYEMSEYEMTKELEERKLINTLIFAKDLLKRFDIQIVNNDLIHLVNTELNLHDLRNYLEEQENFIKNPSYIEELNCSLFIIDLMIIHFGIKETEEDKPQELEFDEFNVKEEFQKQYVNMSMYHLREEVLDCLQKPKLQIENLNFVPRQELINLLKIFYTDKDQLINFVNYLNTIY